MSDIETIQALRQSDKVLENTPAGVLSVIARYSRPNVYTFPKTEEMHITTHHYSVTTPPVTIILNWPCIIHCIIGTIGDDIYFVGLKKWECGIFSFSMQSRTFTFLRKIDSFDSMCISFTGDIYICGSELGPRFSKLDRITGEEITLPGMIARRVECGCYYYNGSVYAFGGFENHIETGKCERFDIKENKWYKIESMPSPNSYTDCICERDGCLFLITTKKRIFMYDIEKDAWSIPEWNEAFARLKVETLRYNRGKFYAISEANGDNPMRIIWESSSPERPWKPILDLDKRSSRTCCVYLHLTYE